MRRGDSLVIDRGSAVLAVNTGGQPLTVDQRAEAPVLRSRGNSVDIGAVERYSLSGTLTVSTSAYELDADVSNGDLSLAEAISLANGSEGTDTILFATSTNAVPINLGPAAGRLDADLIIRESVIIRGNGTGRTILDGGGKRRILDITEDAVDVQLESMLLRNGDPDLAGVDSRGPSRCRWGSQNDWAGFTDAEDHGVHFEPHRPRQCCWKERLRSTARH
jgi:hypothetical protein